MDRHARLGEHAIVTLHFTPHKLRSEQAHVIKIGRIASDATFPGRRDHDSAGDAVRAHRRGAGTGAHEFTGQDGRVNTGYIRSINIAPDFVAFGDRLLQQPQRPNRSAEGSCPQRLVVTLTHSAWLLGHHAPRLPITALSASIEAAVVVATGRLLPARCHNHPPGIRDLRLHRQWPNEVRLPWWLLSRTS